MSEKEKQIIQTLADKLPAMSEREEWMARYKKNYLQLPPLNGVEIKVCHNTAT